MKRNYLIPMLLLPVIGYLIYNFMHVAEGNGIPVLSFMPDSKTVVVTYLNHRNETYKIIVHDLDKGINRNISENTLFQKCIPISYTDDTIAGFIMNSSPEQYYGITISGGKVFPLSGYPNNGYIKYQKYMDKYDYDYSKLPADVANSKKFKGAQYILTNDGRKITYDNHPLIAIYSQDKKIASKNIFSENNWWKLSDLVTESCQMGLYDEKSQQFIWSRQVSMDEIAFYKMNLYYGVFYKDETKVILVNSQSIEELDVKSGNKKLVGEL